MSVYGAEQVGRVLGARYRLDAPVGVGASATVFRAEDLQLRRIVAVKVLHPSLADDPSFLRRFLHEAQAAAALAHPNVMAVHDWGEEAGRPYLVCEYLGGGSLRHMLDRGRRLTPSQALVVGLEAARGLDHAHRRGLVHRDIKPANLLFGEDRRLRIADFGIARAVAEATWTEPAGVVLSTARYASPEQARGRPVDGRSDIYSLALTLVEAVTGSVPFAADTTVATLMARIDRLMPVSAELGPLAPVVERAGRPDPAERPDAVTLARDLVAVAPRLPRPQPLPIVATELDLAGAGRARATSPPPPPPPSASPVEVEADRTAEALARVGLPRAVDGPTVIGPAVAPAPQAAPAPARPPTRLATPPPGPPPAPAAGRSGRGGGEGTDEGRRRRRGSWWAGLLAGFLVAAVVAAAGFLYVQANGPTHPVAGVVGMSEAQARNVLQAVGFDVATERARLDGSQPGEVLAQQPGAGTKLEEGDTVTLTVSEGPTLKALPELVAVPVADAQAQLAALGLQANSTATEPSEDIPADAVVRWNVGGQAFPAGTEVVSGTTVNLVVSSGPTPRDVPDLKGQTYDAAVAALAAPAVRLVGARGDDEFSRDVPVGLVVRSDPPAGTKAARDSTVTLVVSKGPDYVVVPDVTNRTLADATAILSADGLTPGQVVGQADGLVAATTPAANSQAVRGDRVDLVLGPPPAPPAPAAPTG